MRSIREALILGTSAFLAGVLFTLVVFEFGVGLPWLERKLLLLFLFVLLLALLTAWWKLAGEVASSSESQSYRPSREMGSVARREAPPAPVSSPESSRGQKTVERKGPHTEVGGAGRFREEPRSSLEDHLRFPKPELDEPASTSFRHEDDSGFSQPSTGLEMGPSRLIDIWESYYRNGDGKFNASGLRRQLEAAGVQAEVIPGERLGAGDGILGVDLRDRSGMVYILPNFVKSPRAIEDWFQPINTSSRMARIQRLIRPAMARRRGGEITVEVKGEVE